MDGATLFDQTSALSHASCHAAADPQPWRAEVDAQPGAPTERGLRSGWLTDAEYSMLMDANACPAGAGFTAAGPIDIGAREDHDDAAADRRDRRDEAEPAELPTDAVSSIESPHLFAVSSAVAARGWSGAECDAEIDRAKVMELILTINKTVAVEYLDQFKDRALRNYLAHLETTMQPRGRGARWERRGESPALIVHESSL